MEILAKGQVVNSVQSNFHFPGLEIVWNCIVYEFDITRIAKDFYVVKHVNKENN